jgi:hypothetical protein
MSKIDLEVGLQTNYSFDIFVGVDCNVSATLLRKEKKNG